LQTSKGGGKKGMELDLTHLRPKGTPFQHGRGEKRGKDKRSLKKKKWRARGGGRKQKQVSNKGAVLIGLIQNQKTPWGATKNQQAMKGLEGKTEGRRIG